jgi:copper-containing nitrite reductase
MTMHGGGSASATAKPVDIIRDGSDVPPPVGNRKPTLVHVTLTSEEVVGTLDASAGTTYRYWTFNGKVPGPMIRVKQGDEIEVTLRNSPGSHMTHSIDFHAALGPGGGAALSQVTPGQSKTFTFQATTPGLFVYHCGTPMIAEHMANGMYGLILVEPEGGLTPVEHEYYVMQGEIYTTAPKGTEGFQKFSAAKLMEEHPDYFVINGAVDALTNNRAMPARVGETVRVFYGNAGPNATASVHTVGEIFTKVYELGSFKLSADVGVQTATVPSGGAAVLEFVARFPGKVAIMDHAIARMAKGSMAVFDVTGPENASLMHPGPGESQATSQTAEVTGMTGQDEASNLELVASVADAHAQAVDQNEQGVMSYSQADFMHMGGMMMNRHENVSHACACHRKKQQSPVAKGSFPSTTTLNGCLTIANDGRALLKLFQSTKTYRLEAQPLLFSTNANRLVHVSGYFGSVVPIEDPKLPSFVVDTIEQIAPSCKANLSAAQVQKILAKQSASPVGLSGTVSMTDGRFVPQTIVVNVGEKIVWKNSSEVTHNVVADPAKAVYAVDVKLPSGVIPFASQLLQPGQSFSRTFTVPGVYKYVCTLHEASGMKGVIIVKAGPQTLRASK